MIREEVNNIFNNLSEYSVIVQQCNARGQMGQGIAKEIRLRYPQAFKDYHTYCSWFPDKHEQKIIGTWARTIVSPKLIICNAITQQTLGKNKHMTDLDAWDKVCKKLLRQTEFVNSKTGKNWTLHVPSNIGSGSFGVDSSDVKNIFKKYFKNSKVEVVFHKY